MKLQICLPHEVFKDIEVDKVQIPAFAGDMTILSELAPEVFVLKTGFIRVLDNSFRVKDRYFIKSGFAEVALGVCKIMTEEISTYPNIDESTLSEDEVALVNLEKSRT